MKGSPNLCEVDCGLSQFEQEFWRKMSGIYIIPKIVFNSSVLAFT